MTAFACSGEQYAGVAARERGPQRGRSWPHAPHLQRCQLRPMKNMTQRSLHLDVSRRGEVADACNERSPRDRSEGVEIRDTSSREALAAAERDLLRNGTNGRSHFDHQHSSQIGKARRPPQQHDGTATDRLGKRRPPHLELARLGTSGSCRHATRRAGLLLRGRFADSSGGFARALCASQPATSRSSMPSAKGWAR